VFIPAIVHRKGREGPSWHLASKSCNSCGVTTEQIDGPLMGGFNPRCDTCGATTFVPLQMVTEDSSRNGAVDHSRITAMAGPCACGGLFAEDSPIRCPACRSTEVTSITTLCAD